MGTSSTRPRMSLIRCRLGRLSSVEKLFINTRSNSERISRRRSDRRECRVGFSCSAITAPLREQLKELSMSTRFLIFTLAVGFALQDISAAAEKQWHAGVAKVNISPELPIWLSG